MIERMDVFKALHAVRTDEIVIETMTASLQWPLVSDHPLDFDFLAFGMGHASDFGLGLALARPERKTIVLKGDGGLLMSLGSLVTMAEYAPTNLLVVLLENRTYEIVGNQPLPKRVDFVALARAAGLEGGGANSTGKVERIKSIIDFEEAIPRILSEPGPHFVVVPVKNSSELPSVSHTDHAERVINLRGGLGIT